MMAGPAILVVAAHFIITALLTLTLNHHSQALQADIALTLELDLLLGADQRCKLLCPADVDVAAQLTKSSQFVAMAL
jgi:hypothetical protein